jgi:trk system potassium uptake protein TrkA
VATVSWTTDQVLRRLLPSDEQTHDWIDPTGKVCLVEFNLPAVWAGKKLAGLNEPGTFWLTAVARLGSAEIVTPTTMGQDGDVLMFVSDVQSVDALRSRLEQGPEH